jgi:hypothetical protein
MASSLESLETKLNEALVKNAPFQLPEGARKWIATYAWVFALIGLIFGIFTCLALLPLLGFASVLGSAVGAGVYVFFAWISLLVLIGYTVLLGVATPKLKRMEKSGWNLIFYSSLFFFAYDVFNALTNFGAGAIIGLIWNVLMTTVSLYFIFQVRKYFLGKKPADVAAAAEKKPETKK